MREAIFHIKDGSITNKQVVKKCFADLSDGKYLLKVQSIKKRSLSQNSYIHGVVIPLVFKGLRDEGYDDVKDLEDAKYVIKSLFLKRKIVSKETGEVIEYIIDTHKLTTGEMATFIDDVAKWCAEFLHFVLPMPNEQLAIFEAHYDSNLKPTI